MGLPDAIDPGRPRRLSPRCSPTHARPGRAGLRRHALADRSRPGAGPRPPRHPPGARAPRRARAHGWRSSPGGPPGRPWSTGAWPSVPGLVVLGHYGLERWEGGRLSAPEPSPGSRRRGVSCPDCSRRPGPRRAPTSRTRAARSPCTPAGRPDPQGTFDLLRGPLDVLADETGLVVEPGRMVLELRPAGGDKGDAVRALVDELRPSAVLFVGDDLGDLAAFAEVAAPARRGDAGAARVQRVHRGHRPGRAGRPGRGRSAGGGRAPRGDRGGDLSGVRPRTAPGPRAARGAATA